MQLSEGYVREPMFQFVSILVNVFLLTYLKFMIFVKPKSFLIFPISYGLRFLNFSDFFFKRANASLFQKNLNVFLY